MVDLVEQQSVLRSLIVSCTEQTWTHRAYCWEFVHSQRLLMAFLREDCVVMLWAFILPERTRQTDGQNWRY